MPRRGSVGPANGDLDRSGAVAQANMQSQIALIAAARAGFDLTDPSLTTVMLEGGTGANGCRIRRPSDQGEGDPVPCIGKIAVELSTCQKIDTTVVVEIGKRVLVTPLRLDQTARGDILKTPVAEVAKQSARVSFVRPR